MIEKQITESAEFLQRKFNSKPEIAIILGSGLSELGNRVNNPISVPYQDIPYLPVPSVSGHHGQVIIGTINQREVLIFSGRIHLYEGHDAATSAMLSRLAAKLGVQHLLLTNAAGGINSQFVPGDIVLLKDHINLTGLNPLVGPNLESFGTRFPDMSQVYDAPTIEKVRAIAEKKQMLIKEGVYAQVLGPSYETPAEVRMLQALGADMVGMSTALEAIAARHAKLKVSAFSCITNYAAGITSQTLDHSEVQSVANMAMQRFVDLIESLIPEL
jgi:purine-nucleoside phosphorylase